MDAKKALSKFEKEDKKSDAKLMKDVLKTKTKVKKGKK